MVAVSARALLVEAVDVVWAGWRVGEPALMPPRVIVPLEIRAAALLKLRRIRAARELEGDRNDPLARLLDPTFNPIDDEGLPLWVYEHSRIGLKIPGKLHAKQLEALRHQSLHRWLFWGNQTGKTTFGAIDMVLSALGRHPLQLAGVLRLPPFTGWASALSWELWQKILLPELLTWIPFDRIIDAPEPHVMSMKRDIIIRADNGTESRITGKAAEQGPSKYQSARVDQVWLDEEHPKAIWDEMQPRLLRYGGRTLATMTPILGMTWVYSDVYEPVKLGAIPIERHWFSHAGTEDNPSIKESARIEMRAELANNPSQLAAREHGYFVKPVGAIYPFELEKHGVDLEGEDLTTFVRRSKLYGGVDLGKWRFAFSWGGVERFGDDEGALTIVDEMFSQNEDVDTRAKKIDDQLKSYGVKDIDIYGDCADPDGLLALNQALERLHSPYQVIPVEARLKSVTAGILRVGSLFKRGALKVRRGMGKESMWYRGMSSSSMGQPVRGSRWIWEATNWQYAKAQDGKVQTDTPDDATADGADMMDETRYLVMQWLGPVEEVKPVRAPTLLQRLQLELDDLDNAASGDDETKYGTVLRQ